MIEIVFTACLLADPALCQERTLPPFINVTTMECVLGAQAVLAHWSGQNPGYQITFWTCRQPLLDTGA